MSQTLLGGTVPAAAFPGGHAYRAEPPGWHVPAASATYDDTARLQARQKDCISRKNYLRLIGSYRYRYLLAMQR